MWPLDLHASEVLRLPGDTQIAWAVFDSEWYLRTYPDAEGEKPWQVLENYLEHGQKKGHSPNRMFDERWHRKRYPQIAQRVQDREWASAFDAYCRGGCLDRSPHWLFDELAYRDRYKDLTNEVLASYELWNGYDHFLRHGMLENRIGHVLFDPAVYLAHFDPADAEGIRSFGPFQHFLKRIESGEPELRTSIYFDPTWYLRRYPEIAREIQTGRWKCALQQYLCNYTPSAFDPLEWFSESYYLRRDPGLQDVIAKRAFSNGYTHFLRFGAAELRAPSDAIDLVWYAAQPPVKADLQQGRAPDAFAHWLTIGLKTGLRSVKPQTEAISPSQAQQLSQLAATALLPIAGRFGYSFVCADEPVASVVMVVRDAFATTMATIASLRASTPQDIELIIVDCGSSDETTAIVQYVAGAKLLRFDSPIKWSRAADAGRHLATSPVVLTLASNATIAPGSLQRALTHFASDPAIGAVGGKILQPNGVIAQAGGILWNTGLTNDYRRGQPPADPEANFVRTVDFCAAAILLVRASLLDELDGWDHDCPDGYDAVDLCLRIAQAGSRVLYDPSVMVTLADAPQLDTQAGEHFTAKHAAELESRFPPGGPVQVFARHAGQKPPRLLFIEDTIPLRRTGSGFVRANDLVHVIASFGIAVTVFPVNGCDYPIARVFGDMPESAEIMHNLSLDRLTAFLEARPNYYDTVWIARTHNLAAVRPILERAMNEKILNARIVLDTEAVTPVRDILLAGLNGEPFDFQAAMQDICDNAEICQQSVAVTNDEAQMLRSYGLPNVQVIGHMIEPKPGARPFEQRAGMLFVGAIHKTDSPNYDSLVWFVDQVLPLIEADLKWETRLTIAGYTAPGIDLSRFEHHPRITLRGPIAELAPLYNAHRIFVAPTRYAAGAPYKVLEAAAHGVPVVATSVLRGELGWTDQEILSTSADDPEAFAARIISLYRNQTMWQQVREGALRRLRTEFSSDDFISQVASVLTLQQSETMQQFTRLVAETDTNTLL